MNSREHAIKLRLQGYSYTYIAKVTGLSKSTLSYHLASIPYKANTYTLQELGSARRAAAETKAKTKLGSILQAKAEAERIVSELSERDRFMVGLGLYIGEGSKTQGHVRLVNSDPKVVSFFITWLRHLDLLDKNIALRVHHYNHAEVLAANKFWLKETGLPKSSLQPACIDRRKTKKSNKTGLHPNGTAHVTVRAAGEKRFGVYLARLIGACSEKVLVYRATRA